MQDSTDTTSTTTGTRSQSFSASNQTKPKGILKHSSSSSQQQQQEQPTDNEAQQHRTGLAWDEENLTLNEVNKDSKMVITEPKTPYVRYNAETDEVMDLDKIPGFELGLPDSSALPPSPSASSSNPTSRRGSEASEKMVKVQEPLGAHSSSGGEDGDESYDEENEMDEEVREHRKKFKEKRGGHYKNEAEAMKRAQALLDEEESSSGTDSPRRTTNGVLPPPVPVLPVANGV